MTDPVTVLGASDTETQFGHIIGAAFANDTTFAVADATASSIRFYELPGRHLASYGRKGPGPEEFRSLFKLSAKQDTIVAYDAIARRLNLVTPVGGFDRSIKAEPSYQLLLDNDAQVVAPGGGVVLNRPGPTVWFDTMNVAVVEREERSRAVARVPSPPRVTDTSAGFSTFTAPFTAAPAFVSGPRGFVVADGRGSIVRYDEQGRQEMSYRSPFEPRNLEKGGVEAWIRAALDEPGSAAMRAQRQRMLDVAPIPATMPAHGPIVMDREGNLWVAEYRAPYENRPTRVVVLDTSGRLIGQAVLPGRTDILAASRRAIIVRHRNDMDVESVHVFAVMCSD